MNSRNAGWYVDQWDSTLLRWWSGEGWSDHYLPNIAYPQPDLPRHVPAAKRLGIQPKTTFSPAVTSLPGWYEQGGSIRWWDGVDWTDLYYPKRFGVNFGGGSSTGYLVGLWFTILLVPPLLLALALAFGSGKPAFGFVFSAILSGNVLVAFVLKANLKYMSRLRESIYDYSLSFSEKPFGS